MGATRSVTHTMITHETYLATWEGAQAPLIKSSSAHLCTYTGQRLKVVGMADVDVQYYNQQATLNLVIVYVEANGALEAVVNKHTSLLQTN